MRTELHFYGMEINACCFVTFGKLRTGEIVSTNRFFSGGLKVVAKILCITAHV